MDERLVGFIQQIDRLPETTFRPGAPAAVRARELSLLDSVLPLMVSDDKFGVTRNSKRDDRYLKMHYQVQGGGFPSIWIVYDKSSGEITLTVNGRRVPTPDTKEGLIRFFEHMLKKP